jgi:hypothetical protein
MEMQINKKLLFICAAASLLQTLPAHAVIEESGPTYTTYPLNTAAIPVLSATGSKSTDPTFGTEIMRLTDSGNGSTRCANSYSNIPVFNADNTRLAVRCEYPSGPVQTLFYTFDAGAFTVGGYTSALLSGDATWSGSNANLLYSRSGPGGGAGLWYGTILESYNVATGTTVPIKNFASALTAGYGLNQMSRSEDDEIFAFTIVDNASLPSSGPITQKFVGFLVWKKTGDQILLNQTYVNTSNTTERVDQVHIDKTGRYLSVQGNAHNGQVWDLQAPAGPSMTQLVSGRDAYTHEDVGHGTVLSACGTGPGVCYRPLSRPDTAPTILPFSNWNQANLHFTMLADNEGWGLATNAHSDPATPYSVTLPFHGEIFQVATDGSGRVRRIVHTNTNPNAADYWRYALGNLSRDGRFVAWTSDWGGYPGARADVYLAKIDPAPKRPGLISGPLELLPMGITDGGKAAMVQQAFNTPADSTAFPTLSKLRVFEDSVELSLPHSAHSDIRSLGGGRFSHWVGSGGPSTEALRFSASDVSGNPLTNGLTYRFNVPDRQRPLPPSTRYVDGTYACLMLVSLGHLADTATYRVQSTLRLFEDGIELKRGHSLHADIRNLGGGRFSHQITGGTETLRFSALDASNPCSNGKDYTYIIDSRLP